jgi:hypothetical protein
VSFIELAPPALTFQPRRGEQRLTFTIVLHGNTAVRVNLAGPAGRPFRWSTALPRNGWLTPAERAVDVEVSFDFPPALPPVSDFVTVYASDGDGVWLEGTPRRLELRGNVPEIETGTSDSGRRMQSGSTA